jgi:hypothetical protein
LYIVQVEHYGAKIKTHLQMNSFHFYLQTYFG